MLTLARVLESEVEEFAREFEPEREQPEPEAVDDLREMFAELERMEFEKAATR